MKYVEPIKSIILTFLVLLSISLTLIIWSYEPDYEFLEDPDIQQVSIGEEKSLRDIVRPYKVLFNLDSSLKGSVSIKTLDKSMDLLAALDIGNIRVAKENARVQNFNNIMSDDEQVTMFFNTTIPLETLNAVLNFNQNNIENVQFDRIVLNTKNVKETQTLELRFINTQTNMIYRAAATIRHEQQVYNMLESFSKNAAEYEEFKRPNELSLFLPKEATEATQYMYFTEEIDFDDLASAMFTDASLIQRNVEDGLEKYSDDMSLMEFDTKLKTMNYVNGSAELITREAPSKLVGDTFNFVNDHGGFNADFRLSHIDVTQKLVDYQLFFQGHPVFSSTTLTRISTTLGDNRLFRYRRPYYVLDTDISTEKSVKKLPSGAEVISFLENQIASPNTIEDVVMGYLLVQNQNTRVFVLEPNWFSINGNSWSRLTLPTEGSVSDGLE